MAENAEVTYTVWHGRRGTGEYANFTYQDASYVQVGVPTMEFEKTPPFVRTDLTQYTILSGQDGDATKVLFQYTPTKEFPLFYLYFAIEEYGGFSGHVYPYMSIHLYDGEDNVGCVFYNEFTEMGVQDGFIYDGVDSYVRYYRPWDVMVYDLSAYVGRTITIEMIATCCSNHHCWTHFYTAFEKARPADICGNCDNNVIVAPAYSNPIWRKGSSSGPIISDAEEMHITREMVDDYYCTLSTYCGPMTFLLGRALDVVPDFSYKTLCAEGKDTLFLSNKSYMKYRTSHAQVPCDTALWTFSDGQQSTQINVPYVIFSKAGKYTISLRTGSANFWCDSIITKEVPFGRQDYTDLVDSVCQEDLPYRWRGKEYRMSGDYTDTIPAQLTGCDSVLHLLLTVLDTTVSTTTYTICEGETITWNGKKYSAQGIYRDTLVNVAGCDSLLTLNIKYKSCSDEPTDHPLDPMPFLPIRDTLDTTICIGDTLMWHGIAYAHDTTARDTGYYSWYPLDSVYWVLELKTEVCCDTTYSTTDTIFLYDSLKLHPFMWFEKEYVEPGVYNDTILNTEGCDSIGSLLLRVIYKDSVYACGDEQVTFHTPWGDYDSKPDCECLNGYLLQTLDGEWLVDATLCVNRLYTDTVREDTVLCFGTSIEWHGITVDQTHEYEFHEPFQRLITCDSIVYILNATIKDEPINHPLTAAVCAGTSYTWTTYRDSLITAPGIYYDTLWTDHGCYSDTYVLTLTHKAHSTGDTTAYVCYGDMPYEWHGKTLVEACDTSWTTTNVAGCDSVVTLHLFVGPEPKDDHADTTICYSDRIDWHGQTINAEGTYYDTARVTMGNGSLCDSIWYELAVTIQKSDTTPSNISICAGSEYVWKRAGKPDSVIRKAGEYWDTVHYVQTGCDSMIYHLTLQVEDINRDSISAETCANTPYLWRGQSLTAEGIYRDTAKAKTVTECDTVYTLRLTINQPTIGDTIVMACDSFTWHGVTYTESTNTATWTTTNIAGCDSIVTLHLTIHHASSSETNISICPEELPYTWNGKNYTAEGDYTYRTINAAGCDSTATLHLKVIQCCPDTIMRRTKLSICDTLMPYTWVTWREVVVEKAGSFADTLRNDLGCDSIIYTLILDTFHCCAPLMAAIDVPDYICADAPYLPIEVKLLSGECASYSLHFTNPALNKMPFRDTTITIDVQYASDEPFILDIPVPDDPDDSTHYVRPDDNYKVSLTLHDRCGNSIIFGDSIFSVYYPSWVTDQHWDDVIALLNNRYNGGYTFSSVQWLRDGEELAGEDGLYIYLPHELWTNPSHQYQSYFYQALLTRTDDGKTLPTCPLEPWHIDNTNVLSDPYVSVTPTLVPKENPVVHVMTNTEGTYWIYDPAGKLLQTADYEPCEHSAFDIRLYCVQTMYILVFTPRNEKNPLQHKYSVVKVLVE